MTQREFTPAEKAWIAEALSRAKTPTAQQMDVIKSAFRRGVRNAQAA